MSTRTITVKVEGMTCGGCEASLVKVLSQLPGVVRAEASHTNEQAVLEVEDDGPTDEQIDAAIDRAGFTRIPN